MGGGGGGGESKYRRSQAGKTKTNFSTLSQMHAICMYISICKRVMD